LLLIALLVILSLLFGGFHKGTKASSQSPLCTSCISAPTVAGTYG